MQISLNWLKDYVEINNISPKDLGLKFTMASAEVEGIDDLGACFNKVVAAKITAINPHPNAEKLRLATVDNGSKTYEVVCGAPNIEVGQMIPLAELGAVLPGNFKIKKSNIRGFKSVGMLCSGKELGLTEDSDGIMILPEDTKVGLPFKDYLNENDHLIEIDNKSLTHRPDLWGHYGIAREMAAILKSKFTPLNFDIPNKDENKVNINVDVLDKDLCNRYSALAFDNIQIKQSPEWLQKRLKNIGSKPINNVVDATNYVMFELGQPLHAFDGRFLKDNKIVIRRAKENEKITTLDEVSRELTTDMLVIADNEKAVALAGVMGGENSEVLPETTFVILESANFNAANIRRTSTKLGLRTEASARFEKSLDSEMTVQAISRFYQILKESCPEIKVVSELADQDYSNKEPIYIEVSPSFINKRLGTNLKNDFIEKTLTDLGFEINSVNDDLYKIKVPTYRATKDIGIKEDIVEEIGRVYGYDNIEPIAPKLSIKPIEEKPIHLIRKKIRETFSLRLGFKEVYNYSFVGTEQIKKLGLDFEKHIKLSNPLSKEQEYLRINLIPNMLNVVKLNLKNYNSFSIYELGKVFLQDQEDEYICAMHVEKNPKTPLFFKIKEYTLNLLDEISVSNYELKVPEEKLDLFYHSGRTAIISQRKNEFGIISEIHPRTLADFGINGRIGVTLLKVDSLLKANLKKQKFKNLPKYPFVPFDISLFVDKKVLVADVEKTIKKVNSQLIRDIKLFDLYEGKNLPENKKSLAFKIEFYSNERTLEPKEIEDLQNSIMKTLNEKGYEVRGG